MLLRLIFASLLLAASAPAQSPVVSSSLEPHGFVFARPEEADFTVTVTYEVPGVVADRDTYSFKRFWSEVTRYADGSMSATCTGGSSSGKCRDGFSGGCNGVANVQVKDAGPDVTLDLTWDGKRSGHLRREFLVPWSELDKTVEDPEVKVQVAVRYRKA